MGAAPSALAELVPRACPTCGSEDDSRVLSESNVEVDRLDAHAFASRKVPELMRHRLVECPVCDTVYAAPAPRAEALAGAYEAAAYDSEEEARYAARTYARLVEDVLPMLPPSGGALDIGAGDGALMTRLKALGLSSVEGVEPSAAPVAAAPPSLRERIHQEPFRPERFEPGSFRLITVCQTIEHVPEPLRLAVAARELLCPGGALLVVCHDRRAPLNRILGARSPINDVEHLQLFSRESIRGLLDRAGLTVSPVRRIANRYPLRYWTRLAPIPGRDRVIAALDRTGLGRIPVPARVGNLAAVAFRPARP